MCEMKNIPIVPADIAASFQNAVVDSLITRAFNACEKYGFKKLAIAGGVASNSAIRAAFEQKAKEKDIEFHHPSPIFVQIMRQ